MYIKIKNLQKRIKLRARGATKNVNIGPNEETNTPLNNQDKYKGSQYTPYRYRMGRISLAKKYYEETETDDEPGSWLVLYDFKGIKPSSKFWTNIHRIHAMVGKGTLIQYSVFTTDSKRGAITAVKLAKHYGAQVKLFKATEVTID